MADQTSKTPYQYDPVVQEFATTLRQRLGSHLRQLLLFGSRARGDAQDGSDYDMLVVVDNRTPELRAVILEVESQLLDRPGIAGVSCATVALDTTHTARTSLTCTQAPD